jgi:hypothetical protein
LVVALSVVCFRVVTVFSKVVTCRDVNPVVDCELEVCGDDVRIPEVSDWLVNIDEVWEFEVVVFVQLNELNEKQ